MAKLVKLAERKPLERKFLRPEQLKGLLDEAQARLPDGRAKYRNGELLANFLKLLAYSGAREQEALALRWPDVDFERKQLTIGSDGDKNSKAGGLTIRSPGICGTWRRVAIRKPISFFPARSAA
jgi:integrase